MAGCFFLVLLATWLQVATAGLSEFPVFNTIADLPVDENGHLASHWMLFPPDCINTPGGLQLLHPELPGRKVGIADGELGLLLKTSGKCPMAVSLEMGTEPLYYEHHNERFVGDRAKFQSWLDETSFVEIGWINFADPQEVVLYWISSSGEEIEQQRIKYGEPQTHWRVVHMEHAFRVRDSKGNLVGEMTAAKNEIFILGTQAPLEDEYAQPRDRTKEFQSTDKYEHKRAAKVKRTFTEHGFNKVKVPLPVFGSIRTYYYNNRHNLAREDWGGKGLYVNWWEADPIMIQPPFGLKRKWHDGLKPLAEEWVGTELEETDLYGMRKYQKGAKLLKHVDRESTHAISMIVNVDQSEDLNSGAVEPWQLDINDHQTEQAHLVTMNPGDMVFYESARCLHGRPEPLQGQYYVNLFVHYRPVGNPRWYTEELATAPLDGVQITLAEMIARNGATPAEGELKLLSEEIARVPTIEKDAGKLETNEFVKLEDVKRGRKSPKGRVSGNGTIDKVKDFIKLSKDGVVKTGGEAFMASVRARGKFSARIEKHARTAHKAIKDRVLSNQRLSFMHGWVAVMTPNHTTILFFGFVIFILLLCCCMVRGRISDEFTALPQKYEQARKQGQVKKSDDGSSSTRGFGDWDATKAAHIGPDRMEPKIRSAAASGNFNVIKTWAAQVEKDSSLSLDIGDVNDRTVLHLAAKSGHDDIVRLMLLKGCDPNPRDRVRQVTPLHLAAMEGRGLCVKLLLDHGASIFIEDVDRATPLQLAKAAGNTGCTVLLEKAEAKANEQNSSA